MTRQRILVSALLAITTTAGCATRGQDPDGDPPDDFSGPGSGSAGGDGGGLLDDGTGPDEDDLGAPPAYPTAHPRIYIAANEARLQAALSANAPAAARFQAAVDAWVGGANTWGFQIWNAALIGQLTGDPKYCAKAVAAVDAHVAAEEAKIAGGTQQPVVANDSYLHVGGYLGDLALVYDWCFDTVTAAQKTRWLRYANMTLFNLWNPTQARWGTRPLPWTGWSVDNPANNYYYSFLRATMLVGLAAHGEDAQAAGWLAHFRDTKVLGQLVPAFDAQLAGGGSREGTAYGVAMRNLFHLYDLWYATTGEKLHTRTKHARRSLRAFVHQVMPTLDRFVPAGDQPRDPTGAMFDYQRAYLQNLIALYPGDPVAGRAKSLLAGSTVPRQMRPEMLVYDFLYDMDGVVATPLDGMHSAYHATGIGQLYARSGWDRDATWLNLTAGAYTESHAHQDQGALQIYKGGWLAADGVLGSQNGLVQDVTSHTLVRIDVAGAPLRQWVGTTSQLVALHDGPGYVHAVADVTAAYKGNPAVSKVQRELVFIEPDVIVVYDRVATAAGTTQTWQLATPNPPSVSGATATIAGAHALTVQRLAPAGTTTVKNLSGTAGYRSGYRLDTAVPGGDRRFLHVLSLDGAAISATATGDSAVTIALAGDRTATVEFARDAVGATLALDGATIALGVGVDALPE